MPARRLAIVVTAVVAAVLTGALVSPSSASRPSPQGRIERAAKPPAQPAIAVGLIVQTKDKQSDSDLRSRAQSTLGKRATVASAHRITGRMSTVRFTKVVKGEDAVAAARVVANRTDVEWAVPDMVRFPTATTPPSSTNDPEFLAQKHLWDRRSPSTSLPSPWPNGGFSTRVPYLWRATKGSSDVVVAVIDTGITSHYDLSNQTLPGYDFTSAWTDIGGPSKPEYQDSDETLGWDDKPDDPGDWVLSPITCGNEPISASSWHGTHVAGIVAAEGNNGQGVVGVAPGVKILPIRVSGHCGALDSDIFAAIEWATGKTVTNPETNQAVPVNPHPAKVINISLGSDDLFRWNNFLDPDPKQCDGYDPVLAEARSRGAVVVTSAGNSGIDASYTVPAACNPVITVGASGARGLGTTYSNWGEPLDLSAYGGDYRIDGLPYTVLSTYNGGTTTPLGHTTDYLEGTSMAAPMVSATAALLFSLGMTTPAQVEAGLLQSVHAFPAYDTKYGSSSTWGELNCRVPKLPYDFACGAGLLDLAQVQANISPPTVSGYYRVGQTLKASTGSWNASGRGLSYQWLSDNQPIDGATSSTYKARGWDLDKKLSVRIIPKVSAFKPLAKTSAQTPALIQAKSTTSISLPTSISNTKRAYVTVTVKATGYWPSGPLKVYDGSKNLVNVTLSTSHHGTRTIKLPTLAKGYHKITVQYGGSTYILPSTSPMKQIKSK